MLDANIVEILAMYFETMHSLYSVYVAKGRIIVAITAIHIVEIDDKQFQRNSSWIIALFPIQKKTSKLL